MPVADANALMATIVPLPWSDAVDRAFAGTSDWIAPSLVQAELANAIWKSVRTSSLTVDQGLHGLIQALSLVRQVADQSLAEDALRLSIRLDQPAYDCFYLALAQRSSVELLTADRKLQSLAKKIGVGLFSLN